MRDAAVGTIVARNFLPFARVLARSFREHHPAVPFFVVITDGVPDGFALGAEPFETITLDDLGIPDLHRLCFRYGRQQLSIVVKPYLLRHLLGSFSSALFLDADILVTSALHPLFDAAREHAVALTPHLLAPLTGPHAAARELNILQSGVYNGGFVSVSRSDSACGFLAWWADRLHTHCRHDPDRGMHYDQRWLDLVPGLFDNVGVVRDPGCNVAYWNLPERTSSLVPGGPVPCRFFHFSGFEPDRPTRVTRYSSRLTMENAGPAAPLFARYVERLLADGYRDFIQCPYAFGAFDNGVAIPDLARQMYDAAGKEAVRFGDPFDSSGPGSFFHWLNEVVEDTSPSSQTVTRLWHTVYQSRPDLQQAFPRVFDDDNAAFRGWVAARGLAEHHVDPAFAV